MTRLFVLLVSLISLDLHAENSKTFFGKVLKVDGHQVMHVAYKNEVRFLSLAFLNTPVRGEPFFDESHTYLKSVAEQKWLMFTIVRYGSKANVKPALVRLPDQKSLNAQMVRQGMSMVDLATKPPPALIDQAINASNDKIGLWGKAEKMDPLNREVLFSQRSEFESFLSKNNDTGVKPYILVKATKIAHPIQCGLLQRYDDVALTAHVATRKGYTIQEQCNFSK